MMMMMINCMSELIGFRGSRQTVDPQPRPLTRPDDRLPKPRRGRPGVAEAAVIL